MAQILNLDMDNNIVQNSFGTDRTFTNILATPYALYINAGDADTTATFQGDSTIKIDGVGTNAALTDTLSIKVSSDITFA